MKLADCPDLLHVDVVLRRVSAEPVLLTKSLPCDAEDQAGVALVYELQLGKAQMAADNINCEEHGQVRVEPLIAEVRIPTEVFDEMPRADVCDLVQKAVERDLSEAVIEFSKKLASELSGKRPRFIATEEINRVLCRAHENGVVDSKALHELAAVFDPTQDNPAWSR